MKLGTRFSICFFAILVLFFSVIVFAASIGWFTPIYFFLEQFEQTDFRLVTAAVSLFMGVWSVYMIKIFFTRKNTDKLALLTRTEFGHVNYSFEAIDDFIKKAVYEFKGIYEVKTTIKALPDGLALLLKIIISPNIDVVDVTEEVQKKVAEYIENYSGLKVLEIEVVIEKIKQSGKSRVD